MVISKETYFPNNEQFDYNNFPFYWIARIESLYTHEMEKTLKTEGLDASRWRVGLLLRKDIELTITDIATKALMKISTITKIVQRMEKEGLVSVFKHENDGRVRLVRLTEQGKQQVDMIVKITAPMFEEVFAHFSENEIETFLDLSKRLFNNLTHDTTNK